MLDALVGFHGCLFVLWIYLYLSLLKLVCGCDFGCWCFMVVVR